MLNRGPFTYLLAVVSILGLASACGLRSTVDKIEYKRRTFTSTSSSNSSSTSSTSSSGGCQHTGTAPVMTDTIVLRGYDHAPESSHTIQVRAKDILDLQITPETQKWKTNGAQFSPAYSQLKVFAEVAEGEIEVDSGLLDNGANSQYPQESSEVFEFGEEMEKTCGENACSCRDTYNITFKKANYDYFCWAQIWQYCVSPWFTHVQQPPYTPPNDAHPVGFKIKVWTDDTVLSP